MLICKWTAFWGAQAKTKKNTQPSALASEKPKDCQWGKTLAHWAADTRRDHVVFIEISQIMESGRKQRVKLYVMTRGQRLPTSHGFIASHTHCSFYNIFPPLPQQSTIGKALLVVQVQRPKTPPGVSNSPLALQITAQYYSKNELESPNCPPLPYKGPD